MNLPLSEVLRPVKHVLLDFDGPVCSIFAGLPASEVAQDLRMKLLTDGEEDFAEYKTETDPLALLRAISIKRPNLAAVTDTELAQLERKAVQSARPTPGIESVFRACTGSDRTVWIVSNNAASAIQSYVDAHGLGDQVAGIFGRVPGNPASMKPSPRLLLDAIAAAAAKPAECIFIGDAVRDVEAGKAAGVATIGYANKPGKDAALAAAGAVVVVSSMELIADALT